MVKYGKMAIFVFSKLKTAVEAKWLMLQHWTGNVKNCSWNVDNFRDWNFEKIPKNDWLTVKNVFFT